MQDHENNIKKKLKDYRVQVDKQQLWDVLEDHIPASKRRKRILPFWWLSGMLIIGLLAIWTYNESQINELEFSQMVSEPESIHSTITTNKTQKRSQEKANKTHFNKSENKNDLGIASTQTITKKKSNLVGPSANNSSPVKNIISTIIVEHPEMDNMEESVERGINTSEVDNDNLVSEETVSIIFLEPLQKIRGLQNIHIVQSRLLFMQGIAPFKKSNWSRISLAFDIGTGMSNAEYSMLQNENDDYGNLLTDGESGLPNLDFSALIQVDLSKRWWLQTGIKLSRLGYRIDQDWDEETRTQTNGTTVIDIDEEGIQTESSGSLSSTVSTSYKAKWYSFHHNLDIPLFIGYNTQNMGRFNISVYGGPVINAYSRSKGAALDSGGLLYKFEESSESPYQNRFELGWEAGVRIGYMINRNMNIYFQPNYKVRSTELTLENYLITKEYKIWATQLGVHIAI